MTATTRLSEGDVIRLLDRNHGDPPGGVVVSCAGPLIWFSTPDGSCHVARRRLVRLVRRAAQQEQDLHEEVETDNH